MEALKKNQFFHSEFRPELGTPEYKFVFKKMMGLSSEVMGELEKDQGFDPRYMRKRMKSLVKIKTHPGKTSECVKPH